MMVAISYKALNFIRNASFLKIKITLQNKYINLNSTVEFPPLSQIYKKINNKYRYEIKMLY